MVIYETTVRPKNGAVEPSGKTFDLTKSRLVRVNAHNLPPKPINAIS
jgi:hypothetical protein